MKSSPKLTRDLNTPEKLNALRALIECKQPTVNLYHFMGTMTVYRTNAELNPDDDRGGVASLGLDNLLLRGARLKDTDYIYGERMFYLIDEFQFTYLVWRLVRMRCLHWTGH